MSLNTYYECNCCLYAQELDDERFAEIKIPEEERENYIDCHYKLCDILKDNEPEFNLKHRSSVGCYAWTCAMCGSSSKSGHDICWEANVGT